MTPSAGHAGTTTIIALNCHNDNNKGARDALAAPGMSFSFFIALLTIFYN
jgi:hypothetical protein